MPFPWVIATKLIRKEIIKWTKPRDFFDGKKLNQCKLIKSNYENQWIVKDPLLVNPRSGVNLITGEESTDFKLYIEARYPEKSNFGIYLTGRYEVQIEDSFGKDPVKYYLVVFMGF